MKRKRNWGGKFGIVAVISVLLVSMLFSARGSQTSAEPEPGKLIVEEELLHVQLEVPNEEAALIMMELGIEFDHGIHEHDGIYEVEAMVTASELEILESYGIEVHDVLMTQQLWDERIAEMNTTLDENESAILAEEKLQILRADHYTNQSATFLYVEAKSSAGAVASTALTATWEENGVEKSAPLSHRSDYGEYLYHWFELPVEEIPATVTVTSNQGGTATSPVTEWLGDPKPGNPKHHYVSDFIDSYMTPTQINERIEQLAAEFPDLLEVIEMPYKTNGYRRHAQATIGNFTNTAVVVSSKAWGHEGGNGIEVEFVNPGVANSPLTVSVEENNITVSLATNASGNLVSTASQVVHALNAHAGDVVSANTYRGNTGTGVAQVWSSTLSDGLNGPDYVSREPETVKALRIGKTKDGSKPGVLGYAQEHAREWVTPLVVMETAERLLRNYAHDGDTKRLVNNLDIFLIPMVNPDGANYSFYDYNMQRRNMTNYCGQSAANDFGARNAWGVDLNRNHSVGSIHDGFVGASLSCTSDTFAGPEPTSEPEAKNIVWLADEFENINFGMNIHSHGGYFMWSPGAYDTNRTTLPRPTAGEEAFYWGASEHILKRIQEHRGTVIQPTRTGPIPDVLYSAAGNSADYLWYEKGIYTWNFEVGAPLWNPATNRWVSVGFQPPFEEGHEEALEFANGLIGLFEVAYQHSKDKQPPTSKINPGKGTYSQPVEVSFELSEPATIYYTLDGSRPTFESPKLGLSGTREPAEKLLINETTTINWFAIDPAGNVEKNYNPIGNGNNYNSAKITIK
ncbi:M14 family metallopeptidase [Sutcliffiella sp. NC1]|uniref:M14 family metallopeptidase n=1 Tax=Sutcliffiella sp. NC1 TaxID=3004096 RepID=UPI0022DE2904|nr:M14 family metallopeptidase [Sutcliffiella sp. NC1]WBL14638.1 M14 family metallopeptidase [Sutcliffiella sp. NC1]